jgi:hypothetical protein
MAPPAMVPQCYFIYSVNFSQKWARFLQIKNNAGYMITLNFADLTQKVIHHTVVGRNGAHAGYFISQLGAIRK